MEWTSEASSSKVMNRGGSYLDDGSVNSVSYRNIVSASGMGFNVGFRPRLYIK